MTKIYYESDFKIVERFKEKLNDIPFKYTYFADLSYTASWDGEEYKNCKRNPDGSITVVFNGQILGLGPLRVKREYFIPDSDFEDGIRNKVYVEDTGIVLISGTGQPVTVEMEVVPPYIYIQEIVDNTNDTSPVKALSANQGRLLRERIETVSEAVNIGLRDEAKQRMAADTALGNRITAVTTTANNNKTSLNNLETKFNTNLADLRAKDAELEEAINQEAQSRQREDGAIRESIGTVSGRVTTAEEKIAGLQGNVTTLQKEVSKVKDEVVPQAVAEGIARVVASAPDDLNTLEEIAKYIASDKTEAAKINNAISDLKVATQTNYGEIQQLKHDANGTLDLVLENSRAIQQHTKDIAKNAKDVVSNTQAIGLLAEAVETKAPKVGYAPDLKVDFAKELVGRGVAEPQEIGTIRPTGVISIGDGNATIEKVKGKSVVWNQLSNISGYKKYVDANIELSINDGTINVTNIAYEGTSNDAVMVYCIAKGANVGDKIFVKLNFNSSNPLSVPMIEFCSLTKSIPKAGLIYSATKTTQRLYFKSGGTKSIGDIWSFSDIEVVNLTQMFGAGNEPTTVEEFEARRPLGVSDDYNEGEIISYDAQELKSVGFNAFNGTYAKVIGGQKYHALGTITSIGFTTELGGETTEVTLDSDGLFTPTEDGYVYAVGTDIIIHLTHTYTPEHTTEYEEDILTLPSVKEIKDNDGNQLFPFGLLSADSVHDEITATKAVKRVGRMFFDGSESWFLQSINSNGIANFAMLVLELDENMKAVCDKFIKQTSFIANTTSEGFFFAPRTLYIRVKSSTASTVEQFRKYLRTNPTTLNVELAEPIEVDLEEPLNLTYDAWDFGTEELIAEGKTTPLNADIVYQFNAVDRIRENTTNVSEIEEEVATKQQELTLTVLDNGNIRIGNLQGQTKDFMPATPSGDPMHYAYENLGAVYNSGEDVIAKTPWDSLVDDADYNAKWGLNLIPDDATFVKTLKYNGADREVWQMKHPNKDLQIWVVAEYASDGTKIWDDTLVVKRSGMWYMDGLGDLTNGQMAYILNDPHPVHAQGSCSLNKGRCVKFNNWIMNVVIPDYFIYANPNVEIWTSGYTQNVKNQTFIYRTVIRHILRPSNSTTNLTVNASITNSYISTLHFEVGTSVTFEIPKISAKSIINMLEGTTSTVTITFPSALYDRLMDTSTTLGAELVALLETKSNITFARGE